MSRKPKPTVSSVALTGIVHYSDGTATVFSCSANPPGHNGFVVRWCSPSRDREWFAATGRTLEQALGLALNDMGVPPADEMPPEGE